MTIAINELINIWFTFIYKCWWKSLSILLGWHSFYQLQIWNSMLHWANFCSSASLNAYPP